MKIPDVPARGAKEDSQIALNCAYKINRKDNMREYKKLAESMFSEQGVKIVKKTKFKSFHCI